MYYFAAEQKNTWFDNKTSPIKVQSGKMSFICFDIYVYLFIFVASSTTDASTIDPLTNDSVNWNQLRVLFNEDKYVAFTIILLLRFISNLFFVCFSTVLPTKALKMLKTNTNLTEKEIRDWHAGILRDW